MTAANRFSLKKIKKMHLRSVLRTLVCAVIITATLCGAAIFSYADTDAASNGGLDIEISLDKEKYSAGDNVTIMLAITNNTGKKLDNVSVRYYVPDVFEIKDQTLAEIGVLNLRQTVRTQIQATAKSDVSAESIKVENEKDKTDLYIILTVISVLVFVGAVAILIIRERKRRKIAGTISFVLALIFCFNIVSIALPVSAASTELIFTDDITYEEAKSVINAIIPEKSADITAQLSPSADLTREQAAIISSLMLLGGKELSAVSEKPYLDVPADSFAAPYIVFSVSQNVISSVSSGRFDPSKTVSGYEFLSFVLKASGFGALGEYQGQNGRANVISDALSLPYTDVDELLTENPITCADALCLAVKIMMNPCAVVSSTGSYSLTGAPLISSYENVSIEKAIALDKNLLITANGKNIETRKKTLDHKAYTVVYCSDRPIALTSDFSAIGSKLISLYGTGESSHFGVSVEHTVPMPSSDFLLYSGIYNSRDRIFTSDNTHYTVDEKALDNAVFMLDAKVVDKDLVDYGKLVTFIARANGKSVNKTVSEIRYVYQLSSNDPANYNSYNSALAAAKAITNENRTFLPSAYESFVNKINEIDRSLSRDLTDTDESRAIIAQAESDIKAAVDELDKYLLESYSALDAQIAKGEEYIPDKGAYTEESFKVLEDALAAAKELSRDLLLSEENTALIASHIDAVKTAIEGLTYSAFCDYTYYDQTLTAALAINNDDGKYSESDFAEFKKTIDKIDKGLDKNLPRSDANQKTVNDAKQALSDAIEKLNSKLPCDYSQLDAALAEAEKYSNEDFKYTAGSFTEFTEALTLAKKVKRNMTQGFGNTNQSLIDSAATFLFSTIETLTPNKKCDYSAYDKDLEEARKNEYDETLYTEASYKTFTETLERIDAALPKDLYSATVNNDMIAKAREDIAKALTLLKEQTPCDYTKLSEKIEQSKKYPEEGVKYTDKSMKALSDAVKAAEELAKDLKVDLFGENQALIDACVKSIDDAINGLTLEERFVSEVLSEVYEKKVSEDSEEILYLIKLLYKGEEKEFILDPTLTARPMPGDLVSVIIGANEILEIEIASVSVEKYTQDMTVATDMGELYTSYKAATPSDGATLVFFKTADGKILLITETYEKICEIVYSDAKLTAGTKQYGVVSISEFEKFTEKTLAKVTFAERLAFSAEKLSATDAEVLLEDKKVLYKENAADDTSTLSASETLFEAGENSDFLTLEQLSAFLGDKDAVASYRADLYFDENGKLIACKIKSALVELDWSKGEIIKSNIGGGYARMYALNDGTLLMGTDKDGKILVSRSTDNGKTWSESVVASCDYPGTANVAFFQDEDGIIYVGFRSTGENEDGFFANIHVTYSDDNGKTWKEHSTVYKNTEPSGEYKGVWEPHFGILGGKLTCFYANDSKNIVTTYQNIEYKQWDEDKKVWSNRTVVCDGAKHQSRDGMPVWMQLSSGEYVCVIEAFNKNDNNNFMISLLWSEDGVNWSEPVPVMRAKKSGTVCAAPYIVELPNGQIVISCQTSEAGNDTTVISTVISDGTSVRELTEANFREHAYPSLGISGDTKWNGLYVYNGYIYACGASGRINRFYFGDQLD